MFFETCLVYILGSPALAILFPGDGLIEPLVGCLGILLDRVDRSLLSLFQIRCDVISGHCQMSSLAGPGAVLGTANCKRQTANQ